MCSLDEELSIYNFKILKDFVPRSGNIQSFREAWLLISFLLSCSCVSGTFFITLFLNCLVFSCVK